MADVTDERGEDIEPEGEDTVAVTTAEKDPGTGAETIDPELKDLGSSDAATEDARPAASGPAASADDPDASTAREVFDDPGSVITGDLGPVSGRRAPSMRSVATPRRARVVIKKAGPWSVLKMSLLFYFCVMIVFLLALVILYLIMSALGTLDDAVKLFSEVGLVDAGFKINGGWLLLRAFLGGCALVVLWSVVNVFAVFLYNLISGVIGGIEVTLAERR